MSTPRISNTYTAPYARHIEQYPSQSEDYIPFHFGGNKKTLFSSPPPSQRYYQQRNNNKLQHQYNQNVHYNNDHRYSGRNGRGVANVGQHHYQCQKQQYYHSRSRSDDGSYCFNEIKSKELNGKPTVEEVYQKYFHKSMLEDPWKELMERRKFLHGSDVQYNNSSQQSDDDDIADVTDTESDCNDDDDNNKPSNARQTDITASDDKTK